ncbi:unnamed protein product [Urochloa humidicola]
MRADMCAFLPGELLVEIFRRLNSTAIVRSAGVCKPWRRAIIGNVSCFWPSLDRFNPNLLVGFFHTSLLDVLGAVPSSLEPAAGIDVTLYDEPLSSRDGFLLLAGSTVSNLCLCNPIAGSYRFLPKAAFEGAQKQSTYMVITDASGDCGGPAVVWILAVKWEEDIKSGMTYQIFSSISGEWGPVRRTPKFAVKLARTYMYGKHNDVVVCKGSAYFLIRLDTTGNPPGTARRYVFAMDVRTERTWTTELPEKYKFTNIYSFHYNLVLSSSGDGRLSLIFQLQDHQVEVWVLVSDGDWTLQRTINLGSVFPDLPKEGARWLSLRGFCPRSGCVFGDYESMDLLIDVESGSLRSTSVRCGTGYVNKYPYEMDWPTYISSKMKYF